MESMTQTQALICLVIMGIGLFGCLITIAVEMVKRKRARK
jgi:hypothetical protein